MDKKLQFTHLHVHTQYSLLDGASKPKELLKHAMDLGMESIAVTDHGNMYGAVDLFQTAEKLNKEAAEQGKPGIKLIFGCECYITPGSRFTRSDDDPRYHLVLLAENDEGYHNLVKLVSLGFTEGFYRKPRIDKEILRKYSKGLICLSACIQGEIPRLIIEQKSVEAEKALQEYIDIFGKDNFFIEIQKHDLPEEPMVNPKLIALSKKYGVCLVVTNDSHYTKREDATAQDVLLCIQTGKQINDQDRMRFNNDSYYLKSAREMQALFPDLPEAMENTNKIAARCNVGMTFGQLLLPVFPIPEEYKDADDYVKHLCWKEMNNRYAAIVNAEPTKELREAKRNEIINRLKYELDIIKKMGYAAYFLIVWDFINYCKTHKDKNGNPDPIPVGPGRGSAAGSIVAYLMHITNIEPLQFGLLFERFLNPERVSMPDIDTDFCYRRRGEVLDYVIQKYGADHLILGADVRNGKVSINGWLEDSDVELTDFLTRYMKAGTRNVLCTEISRDGMLQGTAVDLYKQVMKAHPNCHLIASGGVSCIQDIEALEEAGIPAVVFGKAIYEGRIDLKELSKKMLL